MSHVNYLVFLLNTQTGEEFTAPATAPKNSHAQALQQIAQQYSAPKFKCHTAYAENELKHALEVFNRWPGMGSATQRQVHQPAGQSITPMKMSLQQAAQQATGAKIEQVQTAHQSQIANSTPQSSVAAQPSTQPTAPVETVVAAPKSVIEQLKALRQQQS